MNFASGSTPERTPGPAVRRNCCHARGKAGASTPRPKNTPTIAKAAIVGGPVHGLVAQDDTNNGFATAQLKLRPFKTTRDRVFQQPVKACTELAEGSCPDTKRPDTKRNDS